MKSPMLVPLALLIAATTGCEDNPVLAPDHEVSYDVEFSLSLEHLTTLREMEVEVAITDHDGAAVTAFEAVAFESRMEGTESWSSTALELHGGHFSAAQMFYSSGEYEVRVVAQSHGSAHSETIYEHSGHLEVERIRMEVGEFRVEMETFPGHLREGDMAEVKFWIIGAADGHGMGGMNAAIHLAHTESGESMSHGAEEHMSGVYETMHTFAEHGETEVMIEFMDEHGEAHEAAFQVHVADSH